MRHVYSLQFVKCDAYQLRDMLHVSPVYENLEKFIEYANNEIKNYICDVEMLDGRAYEMTVEQFSEFLKTVSLENCLDAYPLTKEQFKGMLHQYIYYDVNSHFAVVVVCHPLIQ